MSIEKSFNHCEYLHLINNADFSRGGAQKILSLLLNDKSATLTLNDSWIKFKAGALLSQFFFVIFALIFKKPKCVFIHSRCYLPFSIVFKLFGMKVIFYTHAHYRSHRWLFTLFKCDNYIAVSNAVGDSLVKQGINRSIIKVVLNPYIGGKGYKSQIEANSINYFASIGSLNPWKGFNEAIDFLNVFSKKHDKKTHYTIVGEGGMKCSLRMLSQTIENIVLILKGYVASPFSELTSCPFIIIPSLEEGFGLVAIEAIFQNKIIIYSELPALIEVCGEDPLSFSFKINSFESFERAVLKAQAAFTQVPAEQVLIARETLIKSPNMR